LKRDEKGVLVFNFLDLLGRFAKDGRSQSGFQDFEVFEVLLLTKLQLVVAIQNTLDLIWFDAIFRFICILYTVYSIIFMISSVSSPQEVT